MNARWPKERQRSAKRLVDGTDMVAKYEAVVVPCERVRWIHRVYTVLAFSMEARLLSMGKVYVFNQSRRVVFPNIPAFGYWDAWICVSMGNQH